MQGIPETMEMALRECGNILGASHKELDRDRLVRILADNPLDQRGEQTPMGIIRVAEEGATE